MRIRFMGLESIGTEKSNREKNGDLIVFPMEENKVVKYEEELQGKTRFFEDVALFSKQQNTIVVCGAITDTCGHKRKSALVAENGVLLGVSDTLHVVDKRVSCGASLRVYETEKGRMGVAVAEDLYFPQVFETLVTCGSDFIVCTFSVVEEIHLCLARALAVFYGTPVFFCGKGKNAIALPTGVIVTEKAMFDLEIKKNYQLIEKRRKAFF